MTRINLSYPFLLAALALPALPQVVSEPHLVIDVLRGNGVKHRIGRSLPVEQRELAVQVRDENKRAVEGAEVRFEAPDAQDKAGGTLGDGKRTLSVKTDQTGTAVARGFRPNNTPGEFGIRVTASFGNKAGGPNTIVQTNVGPRKLEVALVQPTQPPNNVKKGTGTAPHVQVRDEEGPVEGAAVTFTLPVSGASGVFPGDQKSLRTASDETGEAVGSGFRPNASCGRFLIGVRAALADQSATGQIEQQNQGCGHGKAIAIVAAVAGGGVGGCCAAGVCCPKKTTPPPPPPPPPTPTIAIVPGSPTFNPPR